MARKKSWQDIQDQAIRISKELRKRGYGGASNRSSIVESAMARYQSNIGRALGGEMGKRGYPFYDDNFNQYKNTKVSQSTYMGLANG